MGELASLTVLCGRHLVQEASLFFEELQADLSSINIEGDNVDELWCLLDWHRYILAVWTQNALDTSNTSEKKFMNIKEGWEVILEATISLNIRYAFPSNKHQRSASTTRLSFKKSLHDLQDYVDVTEQDQEIVDSIILATCEQAWATPLFHEAVFSGLIDSVMHNIAETEPCVKIEMQRRPSIQSVDFMQFIQVLHEEIKLLIASSPAEEQDGLYETLWRTFIIALSNNAKNETRYFHFYHSLISSWPMNDQALQLELDQIFQERVQELFGHMISPSKSERCLNPTPYRVEDLQEIIALGADVRGEVYGRTDCTLWTAAGSELTIDLFKALVHAGAPYKTERNSNSSPLQAAAGAGNIDIVAFLLAREQHHLNIDINARNIEGTTALHAAAKSCCERVIDILFQQPNIDVNLQDRYGCTPFLRTVEATDAKPSAKYAAIKRFIRNKSVDCNRASDDSIHRPINALHLAAMLRDATLRIIVKNVRGVNAQAYSGDTPLHRAVECNSKTNIEILLKHGADPRIVGKHGWTPLQLACEKLYLGPMELLTSLPHCLDDQCPVPINLYYGSKEHWSPVTFVLRDIHDAGKRKLAHIRLALKCLLAAKPDLEVYDSKGCSVLNSVVKIINTDMLKDLLQAGADVHSRDAKGRSVLNRAVHRVSGASFCLLLKFRPDVNSRDDTGRTPLHRLFRYYHVDEEKAIMLLERGADPDIQDSNGGAAVPVDWERRNGHRHESLVEVLRKHRVKKEQDRKLQELSQQTKAFVLKQKQQEDRKRKPHSDSNPFSILAVEGEETLEDGEESSS
ncbi:hypothetical protein G7Y79_00020g049160 [Physcia stellaris]|nr:hypothetical protein G7Y79_00020g049160 [Physcia stellaris]